MVDPGDTDPITLPLKTQARVESAALADDDCFAGQSLPLLPGFSIPKIPTRIKLLTLQTTQSVKRLSRQPVVPSGDVSKPPRVPALETARPGLCLCRAWRSAGQDCGAAASFSLSAGGNGSAAAALPAGFRCKPAGTHASHWQTEDWL